MLARLAHEQIVESYPQRGACVAARPTIEQMRDAFEARRLIESSMQLDGADEPADPDAISSAEGGEARVGRCLPRKSRRAAYASFGGNLLRSSVASLPSHMAWAVWSA